MNKILIIEDEMSIAELEKDYLELSDFVVEIESDGEKGLQKVLENDYNMVILDLMLPNMDGFEVCRRIREQKNLPVLMVSAKKDDIDKIRGLGLGADDYMTKPFSPSELVARVKAHLFLAQNPNRVFTKEELFKEIWDMESVGDIATVTVHIKKIREKIEINTAKPQYIETIWGVGYRFKM